MNIIEYKGFQGTVEYSAEDECLFGRVLDTGKSVIGYEGESVAEITQMFHEAVDDYLEHCQNEGINPRVGAIEDFSFLLGAELLDTAKNIASRTGQSLNDFIVNAVKQAIAVSN